MNSSDVALVIVALISSLSAVVVAYLGKKINEVHIMVNSNLAQARIDRENAVRELAEVNKANAERQAERISELLKLNQDLHKGVDGGA